MPARQAAAWADALVLSATLPSGAQRRDCRVLRFILNTVAVLDPPYRPVSDRKPDPHADIAVFKGWAGHARLLLAVTAQPSVSSTTTIYRWRLSRR